jgi:hypothetical protein
VSAEGEMLAENPNTALSATENRKNHAAVMAPRLTELIKEKGITDSTLEKTLRAHAVGVLSRQGIVSWKNTNTRQIGEMRGSFDRQALDERQRISLMLDPVEREAAIQRIEAGYRGLSKMEVYSSSEAEARILLFRRETAYDLVKQAGVEDPQGTADSLKDPQDHRYDAIPMDDRITLSQQMHAEAERRAALSEAYQQSVELSAHKELVALEKSLKDRAEGERGELASMALKGTDIMPALKDQSFARRQGDHVQSLARFQDWVNRERDTDDPIQKQKLWREISVDRPTITIDTIMAWQGVGPKSKDAAMFHLQGVRARLTTEGQTFYNAEYAQARENLVHNFSRSITTSPSRGAQLAQMEAAALQEFMVRTNKAEKPESPMAVSQDILTRHGPIFQEFNRVESDQVETALPPRYRGDDGMANLREDWTAGTVNGALASTYLTQMKKLKRLRESPETPANAKPTTSQAKPRM